MEELNSLLDEIEKEIHAEPQGYKSKLEHEASKMYTHYALDINICRLNNTSDASGREGIMRVKGVFDKIRRLDS